MIPVFFCERTGSRRFHRGYHCDTCGVRAEEPCSEADYNAFCTDRDVRPERRCDCGQAMRNNSCGSEHEWRRFDTGETFFELPIGAVFEYRPCEDGAYNWRQSKRPDGKEYFVTRPNEQDGRVLACVCPDGHYWIIDARASNCTMKEDDEHWCWVRHGRPEDGTLHVDKNGVTCAAGAGSIGTGNWHGFLHNGRLVGC